MSVRVKKRQNRLQSHRECGIPQINTNNMGFEAFRVQFPRAEIARRFDELGARLISESRSGDEAAWRRFVTIHFPVVFQWGRQSGPDAAEAASLCERVFDKGLDRIARLSGSIISRLRQAYEEPRENTPDDPSAQHQLTDDELMLLLLGLVRSVRPEFGETDWRAFERITIHREAPRDVAADLEITLAQAFIASARVSKRVFRELKPTERSRKS